MDKPKPAPQEEAKDQFEPAAKTPAKPVQKNREVYWLVAGLVVVGLIFIAYKFGKQSAVPSLTSPIPSPLTQAPPTIYTDPMDNWKTYIDSVNSFQFKYPPDYQIGDFDGNPTINKHIIWFLSVEPEAQACTSCVKNLIQEMNISSISWQRIVGTGTNHWFAVEGDNIRETYIEYRTQIQKSQEYFHIMLWELPIDINDSERKKLIDRLPQAITRTDEKTFDQIISTFTFESRYQPTVDTSNWKTYSNKNLNFSISIPDEYSVIEESNNKVSIGSNKISYLTISTDGNMINYNSYKPCQGTPSPCLSDGKDYGQSEDIAQITVGNAQAISFYISKGSPDNDYHIIQFTKLGIEIQMYISAGGLDQIFQKILSSFTFLN